ncbi:hypothetical protein LCGC14_2662100, partial [marine sediment metagenome]
CLGAPRVKVKPRVILKKLLYCLRYLNLNGFHASSLSLVNRLFSLVYNTPGFRLPIFQLPGECIPDDAVAITIRHSEQATLQNLNANPCPPLHF